MLFSFIVSHALTRTRREDQGARGPHARQAAHHATTLSLKFFSRAEKNTEENSQE